MWSIASMVLAYKISNIYGFCNTIKEGYIMFIVRVYVLRCDLLCFYFSGIFTIELGS